MRSHALALALCAVPLMSALAAAPAQGDIFGPISLVSQSAGGGQRPQQADYAHDPALSEDGRFIAFDGSFGGVRGVWRRDLSSGAVEPVAVGDGADAELDAPDAELPSISASGRYVSFTTTAPLTAGDANKAPDVYVRDMDVPVYGCDAQAPVPGCDRSIPACETQHEACGLAPAGAFTLASAADESQAGLTYEPASEPGTTPTAQQQQEFEEQDTLYGASAAGRSALSADGRKVAFVTTAVSNLDGPQTPALQVAVRDLDTGVTELVSVAAEAGTGVPIIDPETGRPKPVSGEEGTSTYGAVFAPGTPPIPFNVPPAYGLTRQVGASISADGSTVAWLGQDVADQVATLPGEELLPVYSEPLWRRIADGPRAPTLAVSGDTDPLSAACIAGGESTPAQPPTLSDPCQGPFRTEPPGTGLSTQVAAQSVPQLSANGETVAFLANAPLVAQGEDFGESIADRHNDLFVADMRAGLTRTQALLPLTELASADLNDPATTANIVDLGLSQDGSQVAFTTQRTVFPLGSPAYVSVRTATPGMSELFDVDLADDTLTRVTGGYEGGPAEHPHAPATPGVDPYREADGSLSPSFSGDGRLLAFSSTASNLVYGDGNTPAGTGSTTFDGSDAFLVERDVFEGAPPPQYVSPPPPNPGLAPFWALGVSAVSRRDGRVVLEVQAPAAGALRGVAQAPVLVLSSGASGVAHGSKRRSHFRSGDRRKRTPSIVIRTVAARAAAAGVQGTAQLVLALDPRYSALAGEPGGLSATVTVTFSAYGHPALRQSIPVTFLRTVAHRSARRSRKRGKSGARAHRSGAR
jgi:WD40-like Beta Propeller Repeat